MQHEIDAQDAPLAPDGGVLQVGAPSLASSLDGARASADKRPMRSRILRWATVIVAITALAAVWVLIPFDEWLLQLVAWADGAGWVGGAGYIATYVGTTLALLPGFVLTLGAGFLYGPVVGTLIVSPASVLGATLAFVLGRRFFRDRIQRKIASQPRFAAIDRAVEKNAFKMILLLRLSPLVPFSLLNYALGLSNVRLSTYTLASFIGMLPGTFMYVYLGSLITNLSELATGTTPDGGASQGFLYWGGLVATVVGTVWITRVARKALAECVEESAEPAA